MGFLLYGSAGTYEFKPSNHGLVPGDRLIVFCVGGGGGGSGKTVGADGGTTSFGSILSALGGSKGALNGGTNVKTGGSQGGKGYGSNAGGGGGGWYPGAPITCGSGIPGNIADPIAVAVSRTCGGAGGGVQGVTTQGGGGASCLGGSDKGSINGIGAFGGTDGNVYIYQQSNTNYPGGGGGAGYGAGGGGGGYGGGVIGNGGNGGEVTMTDYVIPAASPSVAITVGSGGAGGTGGGSSTPGAGGAGQSGCVCIAW